MFKRQTLRAAVPLLAGVLLLSACGGRDGSAAEGAAAPGITDDTIKLGVSTALSGPLSVFANYTKSMEAYFDSVNKAGGVNGRQIELITYDDAFEPARTLQNVRRLVEQDEVFALAGVLGTQPNVAIMDYINEAEVPSIFTGAGTSLLSEDPEANPWLVPYLPPYPVEAGVFGKYVVEEHPDATVAFLRQAGDFGQDFYDGFVEATKGSNVKIVADQTFEQTDATVDSQMVNLEQSKADILFIASNPKWASQAIAFTGKSSWDPLSYVFASSSSIESVLKPAGLENAKGLMSTAYLKDPSDPTWDGDEGLDRARAILDEFAPDLNINDTSTVLSGQAVGQMVVEALKRIDGEPTREKLMDAIHGMKEVPIDVLIPGITVTLAEDDHATLEQLQLQQFDGTKWNLIGDVVGD